MNRKLKQALLATALSISAMQGAQASVTWGAGLNTVFIDNFENAYRSTASCTANGGCLTHDAVNDPLGYNKVDSTLPSPVIVGDIFAGILNVQNIDVSGSTTWFSSATDQFTGYFAQEITAITPNEGGGINDHITLGVATVDPFGVLSVAAGEMMRLFTQSGGGTTAFESNGTTFDDITKATDGTFWAALGLSGALALSGSSDPLDPAITDGYAYSHINQTLPLLNFSDQEAFLGMNLITLGAAYNAGFLIGINDLNESEAGGFATFPLTATCTPFPVLNPIKCNQIVGTTELEANQNSTTFGGTSPWFFASNDPLILYIPEPNTIALLGLGLLITFAGIRKNQRKA